MKCEGTYKDQCCCNCKHRFKLWQYGDTEQVGWVCVAQGEMEDNAYIISRDGHSMCELYLMKEFDKRPTTLQGE